MSTAWAPSHLHPAVFSEQETEAFSEQFVRLCLRFVVRCGATCGTLSGIFAADCGPLVVNVSYFMDRLLPPLIRPIGAPSPRSGPPSYKLTFFRYGLQDFFQARTNVLRVVSIYARPTATEKFQVPLSSRRFPVGDKDTRKLR